MVTSGGDALPLRSHVFALRERLAYIVRLSTPRPVTNHYETSLDRGHGCRPSFESQTTLDILTAYQWDWNSGILLTSSATRQKQDSLKYIMKGEIGRQTWHFPTNTFIKILSPRKLKNINIGLEPPRRSDYEFEIDKHYMALAFVKASEQFEEIYSTRLHHKVTKSDQLPASWPVGTRGHTYYKHLCRLLNDCVEIGHKTLNDFPGAPQRSERYHKNLKFVVYDRPTGDGINGAAPLKPDLFGGMNTNVDNLIGKSPEQAWWDIP